MSVSLTWAERGLNVYVCVANLERERQKFKRKEDGIDYMLKEYIYQHTWMPAAAVLRPCKVVECGPY